MIKYRILILLVLLIFVKPVDAQFQLPLSNEVNRRIEYTRISEDVQFYSLLKPYFDKKTQDFSESFKVDSLNRRSWLWRKMFKESFLKVDSGNFYIYADPVFDFGFGRDSKGRTTMINTRGFRAGGRLGKKFAFGTEFYENQAKFSSWLDEKIQKNSVVPGFGEGRDNNEIWDFSIASGYISYAPTKAFNFSLGQGKHYLGDGFRSLIMSDAAYNYPFFRSEWSNKRFHYFWIMALLQDARPGTPDREAPYLKKILNSRGITWNIADKLHSSVIYSELFNTPDTNRRMKHEFAVYNPTIVPIPSVTSKHSLWALNFTLKAIPRFWIYNQWIFDHLFEKSTVPKGLQIGIKYFDVLGLKGLYIQSEYNRIEPKVYEDRNNPRLNRMHFLEPLSHPLGNNFEELNSQVIYNYKRWQLYFQSTVARSIEEITVNTSVTKPVYPSFKSNEELIHVKTELTYYLNPVTLSGFTIGYQRYSNNITFPGLNSYYYFTFGTRLLNNYFDY